MQLGAFEFKPSAWPTLAAVLLIAAFIALGFWQIRRGDEKRVIVATAQAQQQLPPIELTGAAVDLKSVRYRTVTIRGSYATRYMMYLDNKIQQGRVGYQIVVPLKIAGTEAYVLVNRGWVAMGPSRNDLPQVSVPDGVVTLQGMLQMPSIDVGKFGGGNRSNAGWPAVYRWVDVLAVAAESGLPLKPYMILEQSTQHDGLVRDWQLISGSPDKNYAYAMQWFTFAGIIMVLWVWLNLKRNKAGN
jgi:surfeit locus 1 family protein